MIAEKIRKIRIIKQVSQDYMAIALNISQSAYSKLENGKNKITFERLQEIALLLGCSTSEIINHGELDPLIYKINTLENRVAALEALINIQ